MASKTRVADTRLQTLQIYKVLQCVRANDKAQIEKLKELGIPDLINLTEPKNGSGALHIAASTNNVDMCQFLLNLGAHPNIQDLKGCTPAMKATELGHDLVLDILITAKADISLVNNKGEGILFYCILPTKRHLRCLQILLDRGADVNNRDTNGFPVFVAACEQAQGCKEMCLKLLEKGANPNAFNPATNRTALMEAAREGALDVVRSILERGGDVNAIDKQRYHAVHFAAKGGFLEILMLLSAYGADIGIIAMDGNTALHHAASGGFAVCCRFLGQRGCNPLWKNRDQLTPQAIAKNGGFKAVLKELRKVTRLYKKYSKPEVKNPHPLWSIRLHDWSFEHQVVLRNLFAALTKGDGTVTKGDFASVLTERGAPVSPEELDSIILLHAPGREPNINTEVFLKGSKYVPKTFLLSSYGPKKKKDKAKKRKSTLPMPICMMPSQKDGAIPNFMIEVVHNVTDLNRFDRDHPPVTPVIDDTGWYVDEVESAYTHINFATKAGDLLSLTQAFKNGVPVDVKDTFYKTPLSSACAHGNMDAVKFLLEKGADVNVSDNFLWTPLHHACHAGQKDIVELLLTHGAKINAAAIGGSTPLMRAVESGSLDCTHLLIQSGANVRIVNKKGENVLDVAKAYGDVRLIDLIQQKLDSFPKPKPKRGSKGKQIAGRKSTAPTVQPTSVKQEQMQIPPTKQKSSPEKLDDLLLHEETSKIDITFQPKRDWVSEPTSADLMKRREQRRYRFKDDADFENFQMPFNKILKEKIFTMAQKQ